MHTCVSQSQTRLSSFRTASAASSLINSSNPETFVYSLLGHTPESGIPKANEYSLTAHQLLHPFTVQLQLPDISNKHVRCVLDTCHGRYYIQFLGAISDLDAKLKTIGSSLICQTSSTDTEAYGAVFTPPFCALQSPDSRNALTTSYQASTDLSHFQQQIQMPSLRSFGAQVLVEDGPMAYDEISGLYFFREPAFFQHAVMLVQGVRFDLAARTFHTATLQAMEECKQNLQVISCYTKMDSSGRKLGIFAVRVPSLHEVVSAHVHYDALSRPEAINIRETKRKLFRGPSPHIKYYIAEDAPWVPTQDREKKGLDIRRSLAQAILPLASNLGRSISCWNQPIWNKEYCYVECSGEVFVARSGRTMQTGSDLSDDNINEQVEACSPLWVQCN